MDAIRESEDSAFLISVFRTGRKEECEAAAERFVSLPSSKLVHLIPALKDADENVRTWSAVSMGRIKDAFVTEHLVDVLKDDDSERVRDAAFDALKAMRSTGNLIELISAERAKTSSLEGSARLGSYLDRMLIDSLPVHTGRYEAPGQPCAVLLIVRREPRPQIRKRTLAN